MQDKFAIRLAGVTKSYRLYSSPLLMGADLLNIPFFRKRIERCPLFQALKGIDLTSASWVETAQVRRRSLS
jgi:hypothetical protein